MLSCILTTFHQFALFLFYFLYFLFKGKPEWQKIGSDVRCTTNNCCLHNPKIQSEILSSGSPTLAKDEKMRGGRSDEEKTEVNWRGTKQATINEGHPCRHMCERYANKAALAFQRFCSTLWCVLARFIVVVTDVITSLYLSTFELLFGDGSGSYHGEIQKSIAEANIEASAKQQQPFSTVIFTGSATAASLTEKLATESGEFCSRKQSHPTSFEHSLQDYSTVTNLIVSAPPPLPPPSPTLTSTIIRKSGETANEKVPPKGGIAVLPPDIMAEAHARVKEREQKINEQKADESVENNENLTTDWTVTSKRFIPTDWTTPTSKIENEIEADGKASEEESEIWRPTSRNVVSRIPRSSDQDAQFIFHSPKHHNVPPNWLPEGSFLMGRSVFSPVREAEEMRNTVNRRLTETPSESRFGSRLDTPIEEPYTAPHINTPFDATRSDSYPNCNSSFPASHSRSQSRIHSALSPVTVNQVHSPSTNEQRISMLRQRSKTVEPREEGAVKALTRQWPPQSNATGVQLAKDNWNIIPSEIVSCRRVMEKSVTDKWTTRDDKGDVVDEWSTRSWKGESDGLRRRGDGTGETWHRQMHVSPNGKTSFIDNRRFYTPDYVIESETRNA